MESLTKRWDFSLEGILCPRCGGEGEIETARDMHRSSGIIPCPRRLFQGHGYPTCGDDGRLHFSDYDLENKDLLMKEYPE